MLEDLRKAAEKAGRGDWCAPQTLAKRAFELLRVTL
jgi:hypothetical protein